jgi:ElaB/YqjD/DUF883 family membrane-anchored ribosome-binding protein
MATSEQLEREVDRIRGRIEETLSDLRERLSPNLLMEDLFDYSQVYGGADFVRNLGRQVTQNPLPVALMGAGLAWLMFAQNSPSDAETSFTEWTKRTEAMTDYESDRRKGMGDSKSDGIYGRASDAMGGARDRASEMMDKARDTTSGAYEKVSRSMSSAMDSVSSKMPTPRGVTNFMQEQPIVLAGIGVAIGAIIGALLPSTKVEERFIGPTAGSLKEQAKDTAREQWERGKEMAAEGWDEAKESARRTWDDAKEEAQRSWDNSQQRMATGLASQTGDMTGSRTPLVPSEQGESGRMANATSRGGSDS